MHRSPLFSLLPAALAQTTIASTDSESTSTDTKYVNHNSGSAWVTYHWKWIIMIVILVVGIVGIWVAACIFRKRHIAKKEKEYELTHPVPLGPDGKPNYAAAYPPNAVQAGKAPPIDVEQGMKEKEKEKGKGKAKWIVKERT